VLPPQVVACKYADAVVDIHSEFILLGDGIQTSADKSTEKPVDGKEEVAAVNATPGVNCANGSTPLEVNFRNDVFLNGNGFFTKKHYIICPAGLVLMPPSLTSVVNRWPLMGDAANAVGLQNGARMRDQMVRASRILVTVHNVNGKGCSYVYEATLVGVDGAGDIAVLKIEHDCCSAWNKYNPKIAKCHPFFHWGSSRAARPGQVVYMIGDGVTSHPNVRLHNAVGAITEGLLSDHRYVEYSGFYAPELVLISAPAFTFSTGMPILDGQGRVIGMQTTDTIGSLSDSFEGGVLGGGFVAGPSQYFMSRVIANLIKGTSRKHCNDHVEEVCDAAGSYYRYVKGYLGLGYDVVDGQMYDITRDYTSGARNEPRVRLDENGKFLASAVYRNKVVGVRVLGLAGLNPNDANGVENGAYYVPGGIANAPLVAELPKSGLLGVLTPGDIILKLNDNKLGDLTNQIAPSLLTWRKLPGDLVLVCYSRGGNVKNDEYNGVEYADADNVKVCLKEFPKLMDYPWYNVSLFPLLRNLFNFPAGQIIRIQYPELDNVAQFQAAI
jgi:S1-C subfamily serine protease